MTGFLWGAATSAHQVEGGNDNNDAWAAELTTDLFAERSGTACDSFHRYPEDIRLVADLGLDAYRFSLEWSRIEPQEGVISAAAVEHYRRMVDCCRDAGVEPVVTLHHFTNPTWFSGWQAPEAVERFARFTEAALPILRDVETVCTINEPNVLCDVADLRAPGTDAAVFDNLAAAHRAAADILSPTHTVGLTVAMREWRALPGAEGLAADLRYDAEDRFLEGLVGDFIGVQCYTADLVGPQGIVPPGSGEPRTLTGWRVAPEALGATVRRAAGITGLPVLVTENGIATDSDDERIAYYERALAALDEARADGVDVRGFFAWSLLDNFEWFLGYRPTFGLVAVDRQTFARTVKPSGRWFAGEVRRRRNAAMVRARESESCS